ncbi:MAG: DegV family protein [Candidatus Omnitrophota bacterium]
MSINNCAIVTDSTCDLICAQELGICVVPLKVYFGAEEFLDNVDIKPHVFYKRLRTQKIMPRTSQPSPGDFLYAYTSLKQAGVNKIISIHLSSKLSGTTQSALTASSMIEGMDIRVIDSKFASLGLGFLCLQAKNYINELNNLDEAIFKIKEDIKKVIIYFSVGSLDYLEKGGRIGKAKAFLGKLLDLKPILGVEGGQIKPVNKVRGGLKEAGRNIAGLIKKDIGMVRKLQFLGVIHSCLPQEAGDLADLLKNDLGDFPILIAELGCVLGSHVGPKALGVVALRA